MKANVYVTLKQEVLDPQGDAVRRALGTLGLSGVRNVRVGKLIEVQAEEGTDQARFEEQLAQMSHKVLANPVIEDVRVEIEG